MKRLSALLLCAAMLLSFAACGGSEDTAPTNATAAVTQPIAETDAPTQAPTDAPTEPPAPQVFMGETVLVDNDSVTFAVTKAEDNEHLGMQLQVQCVNKTGRTLMFSWDMVSVCGYMFDPLWSVEVAAGKTANSTIDLDTYALEKMGILSVDEVTFTLRIVDSENWMEAPMVEEAFTIYPTGLTADTLVLPARAQKTSEAVIADDENVCFIIERVDGKDAAAYTLHVYMENRTGRNLMYAWDKVSVNGFMIDPFWAMSVAAGKKACAEITFYGSDLERNGIEDVSEIEFTLLVSDYDDWDTPNLLEGTYTYQP